MEVVSNVNGEKPGPVFGRNSVNNKKSPLLNYYRPATRQRNAVFILYVK